MLLKVLLTILFIFFNYSNAFALLNEMEMDNELTLGSDIFNDFNEDLESSKLIEDERFYRYGRFFSFNLSMGMTEFSGTRGQAYEHDLPGYGISFTFFSDFQSAFVLGVDYSKHHFYVDYPVQAFSKNAPGLINVNMLRVFFGYRYYIDTTNLGTAITYANPYFVGRLEYWYTTYKYVEQPNVDNDSNGALGSALGFGLEFPIKLKESYLGVEFLYHRVNFEDKYTQRYRPINNENTGYNDMSGDPYGVTVSYVFNW